MTVPAYRLTVEYDGTDFAGWQVQSQQRTAMGALRDGCLALHDAPAALTAAGRTDSGAHAHGQVVGVALQRDWEPAALRAALNAVLPQDIAVVDAGRAASSFHARHDAVDRTYRYLIVCRSQRSPVTRRHAWTVRGPLDVDVMRTAARHLVGRHDFAAFGRAPLPGRPTTRTVHDVAISQWTSDDELRTQVVMVEVRADAFLRGMMRAFAGALVRIGQHRATPEWLASLLDGGIGRDTAIPTAPAHGLHQWRVSYAAGAAAA